MLLKVWFLLLLLSHSGAAQVEKLANCCTATSSEKIHDKILGYLPQKKNGDCVLAAVVQTEQGFFCVFPGARWFQLFLRDEKQRQAKAQAATAPPKVTLLSILSSSSAPSESSAPFASSTMASSTSPAFSTDATRATTPSSASSGLTSDPLIFSVSPGDASPGDASPGDASPGDAFSGLTSDPPTFSASPGDASSGLTSDPPTFSVSPGDASPGDASPGDASSGDASGESDYED